MMVSGLSHLCIYLCLKRLMPIDYLCYFRRNNHLIGLRYQDNKHLKCFRRIDLRQAIDSYASISSFRLKCHCSCLLLSATFTVSVLSFQVEIIKDLPEDKTITVYRCGPLVDLCRGPHIPNTSFVKAFSCLKVMFQIIQIHA